MKSNWIYKPIAIEVEMTHQCNLFCGGCAIRDDIKRARHKLTEQEILDFLKQSKDSGIIGYSLTGGEPFLNFSLLKKIIFSAPIDLIKINTNGFIFSSPKKTKQVFEQLKQAGFGSRNTKLKSSLNISIGQQTAAGIPLEFVILACRDFYRFFSPAKTNISINIFSLSEKYSIFVINKFYQKYFEITRKNFPEVLIPIKFIPSDPRLSSTAVILNMISKKKKRINDLIKEYSKYLINCSPREILSENNITAPRMLLRADGSVYTCYGFAHVYRLGSSKQDSFKSMLLKANNDLIIETLFEKGLMGLLKLARKYRQGIENKKISISYGPCNICKLLSDEIENIITKKVITVS
jgi:sulfatase maturation enzyme AslB (radical SAM superfamily)